MSSLFQLFNRKPTKNRRTSSRLNRLETLERRNLLATVTATFDDLNLAPESFWNGPDLAGTDEPDPFGGPLSVKVGGFKSSGATFLNKHNQNYGSWAGFAYSNVTDNTTAGFGNQHSAFPGSGRGDTIYGVASGYLDAQTFDPNNAEQLAGLPYITLPAGGSPTQAYVSNSTYAGLSMLEGDGFAKRFGGASGNDPDFFKLNAYGTDAEGNVLPASAEIYLADYRFGDNSQDFVLDDWTQFDLSALAGARRVYFNVSSSDNGSFGMNTPAYFAIDDLSFTLPTANSAPTLDATGSPSLGTINQGATNPTGTRVSALIAGAVTDPDAQPERGIAIYSASGMASGTWQYSLNNGTNWESLGTPSASAALLLPANALTRVRFLPNANFHGQVTLSYRAWDQTRGTPGGTISMAGSTKIGGTTSLSTAVETAALVVRSTNVAPVLGGISGSLGYTNNAPPVAIAAAATVTDADSPRFTGGKLTVQIIAGSDASNRVFIGGGLFAIDSSRNVIRKDAINGDKIIGVLNADGGNGTTALEVTFTDQARVGYVQQLVRALRFRTLSGTSTAPRTLAFSLTDGEGGTSAPVGQTINVA